GSRYFLRLIGLYALIAILVVLGFLLLIVPGLIFIRRYFLAPYFLVDQDMSIHESMRESAAVSKDHAKSIWGIIGVYVIIALPTVIPLFGSILSAILQTFYSCAAALRYDELIAYNADGN
ncbi:MAG TPA: YciC family protein, partial [Candidatus Saccharimonadales bacterium]|nr:YciC family protein [Candidatus Saccharimonadales bacterium]